ncbi:MAG: response regulator transcription factor [Candidatus Omnitrophica bacterium]|nr:response regulator transcription factor [Candidatus Omnitrophota bacterium]
MNIVLIDDDKELCDITASVLSKEGYVVYTFQNANEGIDFAKDGNPNLILLDMMMPEMSGDDAIKKIKRIPSLKDIPVLFLTALVSGDDDVKDLGLKIDGIFYPALGKPFDIPQLLEAIEDHIR